MRKLLVTAGTLGLLAWVVSEVRERPFAYTGHVEDYHGDDSTSYSFHLVALYRGLDVTYTGPLRRRSRVREDTHSYPDMSDGWCTTHEDYCAYAGTEFSVDG